MKASLSTKLIALISSLFSFVILTSGLNIAVLKQHHDLQGEIRDTVLPSLELLDDNIRRLKSYSEFIQASIATVEVEELDQANEVEALIKASFVQLQDLNPGQAKIIEDILLDLEIYHRSALQLASQVIDEKKELGELLPNINAVRENQERVNGKVQGFRQNTYKQYIRDVETINNKSRLATNVTLSGMLLFAILVAIVYWAMQVWIKKPVQSLSSASEMVSQGEFTFAPEIKQRDEIGALTSNFNHMVETLKGNQERMKILIDKSRAVSATYQLEALLDEVKRTVELLSGRQEKAHLWVTASITQIESAKDDSFFELPGNTPKNLAEIPNKGCCVLPIKDISEDRIVSYLIIEDSNPQLEEKLAYSLPVIATSIANALGQIKLQEAMKTLDSKNREIHSIFESIQVGIFMINKHCEIIGPFSSALAQIFGSIERRNFFKFSFDRSDLSADEKSRVYNAIDMIIGGDQLAFQLNSHSLPREISIRDTKAAQQIIALNFYPMFQGDIIERLMVTMKDITEIRLKENQERKRKVRIDRLNSIIESPPLLLRDLFTTAEQITNDLSGTKDIADNTLMNLHTLKGNSRALDMKDISNIAHHLEECLQTKASEDLLAKTIKDLEDTLNEYIKLDIMIQERHLLSKPETHVNAKAYFQDRLSRNIKQSIELTDKDLPELSINCPDRLNLDQSLVSLFDKVIPHLVANAVDHGISYDVAGIISVNITQPSSDQLSFEFHDSGPGINIEWLNTKIPESKNLEEKIASLFDFGLSSASQASLLSGRGIGLSAIQESIEQAGGSIRIKHSKEGNKPTHAKIRFIIQVPIGKPNSTQKAS